MIVTLTLALLGQSVSSPSEPPMNAVHLSIGILSSQPFRLIGMQVEICGRLSRDRSGKTVLTDNLGGRQSGVYISENLRSSRKVGQRNCYLGMWRRQDGRSLEEVVRGGLSVMGGGYNPEYILS